MRISDWSSDVCSSDLSSSCATVHWSSPTHSCACAAPSVRGAEGRVPIVRRHGVRAAKVRGAPSRRTRIVRSEEHTSELQSLMRISYAVFCLKKKKKNHNDKTKVASV